MADIERELLQSKQKAESEGSAGGDGLSEKEQAFLERLEVALRAGKIEARDAIAQKMTRTLSKDELASYGKLSNNKERQEFRLEWAKKMAERFQSKRTRVKEWRKIDETKGEYKTLAAIAIEFGFAAAPAKALASARRYCAKCAAMAGKWCIYEEMSEQVLFLHLRVQFKELLSEAWSLYEEEHTTSRQSTLKPETQKGDQLPANDDDDHDDDKPAPKAKSKPKAKPDPKARELQDAMNSAMKMKTRYLNISSKAADLTNKVATDASWAWAQNKDIIGLVDSAIASLNELVTEKGLTDVLHMDAKELKQKVGRDTLLLNLNSFLMLGDAVGSLEKSHAKVWKMFRARCD